MIHDESTQQLPHAHNGYADALRAATERLYEAAHAIAEPIYRIENMSGFVITRSEFKELQASVREYELALRAQENTQK